MDNLKSPTNPQWAWIEREGDSDGEAITFFNDGKAAKVCRT